MAELVLERRAGLRSTGERIREVVRLKELQHHFISYRSKVEIAVDALKDIARELHQLEVGAVKKRQTGHVTSSVGSGVLGSALVAGLVTAGPVLTVGLFAGTVLTSVGGLIVFSGRKGARERELEVQVTAILLSLEREFEQCQRGLEELGCPNQGEGLEQLRMRVALAEREGAGGLRAVSNIITNIASIADNLSSRVGALPREVRSLLGGGLAQVQYFISPYGASALMGLLSGDQNTRPFNAPCTSSSCDPGSLMSVAGQGGGSPGGSQGGSRGGSACQKKTLFSSCSNLGKVVYTVGAVAAAYELYSSVTKATELTKRLQRLKDSSDLLKYEGAAKDVFNIAMDLQIILSTVFKDREDL